MSWCKTRSPNDVAFTNLDTVRLHTKSVLRLGCEQAQESSFRKFHLGPTCWFMNCQRLYIHTSVYQRIRYASTTSAGGSNKRFADSSLQAIQSRICVSCSKLDSQLRQPRFANICCRFDLWES